jgi:hypothetical protein
MAVLVTEKVVQVDLSVTPFAIAVSQASLEGVIVKRHVLGRGVEVRHCESWLRIGLRKKGSSRKTEKLW